MKYYLFLLLLAFIACDIVEKKTDEIILKDNIHEFLEKLINIILNCGESDYNCIHGQINNLYYDLYPETFIEITNFLHSPECEKICKDVFIKKLGGGTTKIYCNYICQYL